MAATLEFLKFQELLKINKKLIENIKNESNLFKLSNWKGKTLK